MLLPPFRGVDLKAFDAGGDDITAELFAPNGFMKVDADYTAKPYEEWRAEDWPSTYQVPRVTPTSSPSGSPSPRRTRSRGRGSRPTAP